MKKAYEQTASSPERKRIFFTPELAPVNRLATREMGDKTNVGVEKGKAVRELITKNKADVAVRTPTASRIWSSPAELVQDPATLAAQGAE